MSVRRYASSVLAGLCVLASCESILAESEARALTPKMALETTRVIPNLEAMSPQNPDGVLSISPHGRRFVVRLVRGDVQLNGVLLRVMTGQLGSLEESSKWSQAASLFSSGRGPLFPAYLGPHHDVSPYMSAVRWLDADRIAFLWSNGNDRRQILSIDLVSRETRWLTDHPRSISSFDVAQNVIVFSAEAEMPDPVAEDPAGFVVGRHVDGFSVVRGDFSNVSLADRRMNTQWYVRDIEQDITRPLRVTEREVDLDVRHIVKISPDRRWVIVDATPDEVPEVWAGYQRQSLRDWVADARAPGRSSGGRNIHQLYLVDLVSGRSRPLWNAPAVATITQVAWSPDSRTVVIGPTAVPLPSDDVQGLNGQAAAIVDIRTGRFEVLPVTLRPHAPLAHLRFIDERNLELVDIVAGRRTTWRFRKVGGQWYEQPEEPTEGERACIRVIQDLNTPPTLVAEERRTGEQRVLLELNPELRHVALGRVEKMEGALQSGERWSALLFYPPEYEPGRRYPLVIQSTYAAPPSDEFTLYGPQDGAGLGPSMIAPYAAQSIAGRGIAVLHMNVRLGDSGAPNTPAEPRAYMRAFEHAAIELSSRGIVDSTRVGLLGFSRNGFYVEYALTQSNFPFAAAVAADNWGASYMQVHLRGDVENAARINGAEPYAEGLLKWVERAPGFNAHHVTAPLLMIEQSHGGRGGVLAKWELFSRLRSLGKPVEMFVMPDVLYGAHTTQNPRQILAVQERTIDWFDFWLNGREDTAPRKLAQYQGWRALRLVEEEGH